MISDTLTFYSKYYKDKEYLNNPKWDKVFVTTLFTFYWKKTIETIEAAKYLVKDLNDRLLASFIGISRVHFVNNKHLLYN